MRIDLAQLLFALSDALDLVGIDDVQHGKRVGYMAWECTKAMGLDSAIRKKIFQIGLVHDCGVSSTRVHKNLVDEMDWTGSQTHCDVGAERLKAVPHLSDMALPVYYHHTRWQDLKHLDLSTESRLFSSLIFLVDRVDALAARFLNGGLLAEKDGIRDRIKQFSGTFFDPDLVDVFMKVSASEAFWLTLEPLHLLSFLDDRKKEQEMVLLSPAELRRLADMFAGIVDAKSPFTFRHSAGVALVCRFLAEDLGLSVDDCAAIEIAGLLHDLGKLKVPDSILEKKAALDASDLAHMRHHSYESYMILKGVTGMEDIARWAGNHHEALNGHGYPFHRTAADLCLQSRIIAVADVFQALAQNRPYRKAMAPDEIMTFLYKFSDQGRLDPEVVSRVVHHPDDCFQAATRFAAQPEWEAAHDINQGV